jgi:ABC-type transporter MlaC component
MKKIFTILAVALLALSVFAQAPERMTYQAVVRDADDNLLTELLVGMQISILQGSDTGTAVFLERHFPTTDTNGLATIAIGRWYPGKRKPCQY